MFKSFFSKYRSIFTVFFAMSFLCVANANAEGVLKVYNWAEYIGEETISNFEKEYGIEVTYDNYDSVETVDAKLLAGSTCYDVISHSSSAVARLLPADVIMKLDVSRLPNMKHISPKVLDQIAKHWDPNNEYIVPYMWGTHGVTYNEEFVRSVFPDAPIGSMDLIFDPANMEKLAQCGVAFLDSPTDIVSMALAHLGLDPGSSNKKDFEAAEELLLSIRPYIKTFDNYAYIRMPEKEFCVAVTWGPDGLFAQSAAEESGQDIELKFYAPPGEGKANIWVDGWVVPSDAENVDNAYLFLDYMMRPEVAAGDSNYTWYASANESAKELIDPVITGSEAVYPSDEAVAMMYPLKVLKPKIERVRTRVWTNFKTGN